jgi:rSAM/selenodomain-associated transferase 1
MKPIRIVIFAKAAQPGFAKTRLIPALGEQGAADLAQRMLTYTLREALDAKIGPVELCVTPSSTDAVWQRFTMPDEVQYSDQGEGDLGERLTRVTRRVIADDESVLLIGTDCLELTAFHLLQAADTLRHFDSTLIPAIDGGYALLGLNFFHPSLFELIKWSSNTVFIETLHRLEQLGYSVQSYPSLHDIDEPEDLRWLPKTWGERKYAW